MIYTPAEDSFLLAEQAKKYSFGEVLDIGTGSGILAEAALENQNVSRVFAADINKDAVEYVKNIVGINAVQSDLFSNIFKKYDTIIFNPPYLPFDEKEDSESALITTGGMNGHEVLEKFLEQVPSHLTEKGQILIVFSSLTNKKKVDELIAKNNFVFNEVARQKISFEELYVYLIKRRL